MAAITTAGSGNWSSTTPNAPWPGGTVPTNADTVTIANTHTVTLDTTGLACDSINVKSGGTLNCSASASSDLSSDKDITVESGGTLTLDLSSTYAYSCTIYLNVTAASDNAYGLVIADGAICTIKGYQKTRWTRLNGAVLATGTSITVDDATGWQTGDWICLATTQAYNATPRVDFSTGTNTVSGNNITSMTAFAYDHADNCYVGNFSSNLTIKSQSTTYRGWVDLSHNNVGGARVIEDVRFETLGSRSGYGGVYVMGNYATIDPWTSFNRNIFYDYRAYAISFRRVYKEIEKNNNIYYSANAGTYPAEYYLQCANTLNGSNNSVVFRSYGGINVDTSAGLIFNNPVISGCSGTGLSNSALVYVYGGSFFGNNYAYRNPGADAFFDSTLIGAEFSASTNAGCFDYAAQATGTINALDCTFQVSNVVAAGITSASTISRIILKNKDADPAKQEIYNYHDATAPIIQRNATIINRSTSSIEMTCNDASAISYEYEVLSKAGETITIKTYVRKNSSYGASTLPSVTITGLGITPVVSTMDSGTAADTWELLTTSATNSGSSDGLLTVTFTAQSSTAGAKAYFSGTPCAPFVTRARHYGYLFQETIPTVTVDPYVVAAEATAAAYTGVSIDGTAKTIEFAAGTADTAQKFYDYSRAWCALNVGKEVPFERAGSVYAVDADWTIHDPYYSGDVTWSGGTVQYSTYGTLADNLDGCIIEFADTGGGTYTLNGTLSGTLDLRNLDADPITVEVPTGTTTTDANNTGGAITVTEPQVYQSVVLSSGEAGSRVQLYDVTSSTELYNDVPGAWPFTWTDPDPYSADREIRLRVAYTDGADARQFVDQTIGTVTEADPELTYLVAQIDDSVYNANAIDGSALTGYAIVGSNLTIDVSDGTATWAEMYAYQVYWLSTEDGIRDQDLYIQAVDTANYIFYGGFQIKNTSAPSVPLLVTGGNGEPSSGPATDLLDTTGGTIFCNSAIVVPYSSGAAVTEQIVRDGLTSQGYTTTRANAIDTIPEDVWGHTLP